jgi:hypothetical protein
MTGEDARMRLCALATVIRKRICPKGSADCFCGANLDGNDPKIAEEVIRFIEDATLLALAKREYENKQKAAGVRSV